jgi:hypothetical protein
MSKADLKSVASYQKVILLCILAYLALVGIQFVLPPDSRPMLMLVAIPLGLIATVFVFLLATKVYSTGMGIVLAVLTLIPCIGLIALLIINGKATAVLKKHGIEVGLLGANVSDI